MIVMVPATGIANTGQAKVSVTDAFTLPAMRSAEAISNDTDVNECAVECDRSDRKSKRIIAGGANPDIAAIPPAMRL